MKLFPTKRGGLARKPSTARFGRSLLNEIPDIKIIIFTGKTSSQAVKAALHENAAGFINKISGIAELENASQAVQRNEQFFSPEIRDEVVRRRDEKSEQSRPSFVTEAFLAL